MKAIFVNKEGLRSTTRINSNDHPITPNTTKSKWKIALGLPEDHVLFYFRTRGFRCTYSPGDTCRTRGYQYLLGWSCISYLKYLITTCCVSSMKIATCRHKSVARQNRVGKRIRLADGWRWWLTVEKREEKQRGVSQSQAQVTEQAPEHINVSWVRGPISLSKV